MTFLKALRSGLPIRNKDYTFTIVDQVLSTYTYLHPDSFKDPEYLLSVIHFTKESLLSDKWEVKSGRKILK